MTNHRMGRSGATEDMTQGQAKYSMTEPSNANTQRLPSQYQWEKLFGETMKSFKKY
jgi:hypothetical protein